MDCRHSRNKRSDDETGQMSEALTLTREKHRFWRLLRGLADISLTVGLAGVPIMSNLQDEQKRSSCFF